jgi:hypothetical protein
VRLEFPQGGEVFTTGSDITITWKTNATINPVNQVNLSYSLDNGVTWKAFAFQPPSGSNPGSYAVQFPTVTKTKGKCKMKVVLKDGSGKKMGSDRSDGTFTITP